MTDAGKIEHLTGQRITAKTFDELPSTNTFAKRLAASGAPDGTLIAADCQTAGRGRQGKSFYSPAGTGVYFSLIIRRPLCFEESLLLTSRVATSVAEALEELSGREALIKWVNDIFIGGRKVCGVLTEASFNDDKTLNFAVVGIGVNLTTSGFPDEIAGIAGSVFGESTAASREEVIAKITVKLLDELDKIPSRGYLDEYRRRSLILGKNVTVSGNGKKYTARVLSIDDNARLTVLPDGSGGGDEKAEILSSGEVSVALS